MAKTKFYAVASVILAIFFAAASTVEAQPSAKTGPFLSLMAGVHLHPYRSLA